MADTQIQQQEAMKALHEIAPYAASMLETVKGMTVDDQASCASMADVRKQLTTAQKKLKDRKKTVTDPLSKVVKAINALFKPSEDALEDALAETKRKLDAYAHEQLVIESARQAQERREAAERLEAAEASAKLLREQGAEQTADLVTMQAQAEVAAANAPAHVPQVEGAEAKFSVRRKWIGRIVNLRAFCGAIARGTVPEAAVDINLRVLNEHAAKLGPDVIAADPEAMSKLYVDDGYSIQLVGEGATR